MKAIKTRTKKRNQSYEQETESMSELSTEQKDLLDRTSTSNLKPQH